MKDKLVIIGNGFDLAHGYKTGYDSFVAAGGGKEFQHLVLCLYGDKANDSFKWSLFEDRMCDVTEKFFVSNDLDEFFKCYSGVQWSNWKNSIKNLDGIFFRLSNELKIYLAEEEKKEQKTLSSVKPFFDENTYIINFNYTSTAEKYAKDIFYVHGSLQENDIILGYDHHIDDGFCGEPDVMESELIRRNKRFMREALSYRRFLRGHGVDEQFVIHEGNRYLDYMVKKAVDMAGMIGDYCGLLFDEYVESSKGTADLPIAIDFDSIKEIVIMGHSLSSDKMFIRDSLIRKSKHLEQIVLFSYGREPVHELFKKLRFLNKAVPNKRIKICYY